MDRARGARKSEMGTAFFVLTFSPLCYNELKNESISRKVRNNKRKIHKGGCMSVNQRLVNPLTNQLFDAMLHLESIDECYEFFEDLCTINEIRDMSQRLEVARMLQAGEKYDKIEQVTGASTATISRVKRCLKFGADGYKNVLDKMEKKREGTSHE